MISRLFKQTLVGSLALVICGFGYGGAFSETSSLQSDVNPYAKSYFLVEFARNYPQSFSQNAFETGQAHPLVGYRYNLDEQWVMGLGGQFKIFKRREALAPDGRPEPLVSKELALFTLYHEALYSFRLDHPHYLFMGPKLYYMLPLKTARIPMHRDDTHPIEIGAGLCLAFVRLLENGWMVDLRIERWRGTATMKLHGIEGAIGLGFPL